MESRSGHLIRRILVDPKGMVGAGVILAFSLLPFLRPLITKYSPEAVGVGAPNQPPSSLHPLGTTSLGQDVLSQFLTGGLVPVEVGVLTGIFTSLLVILVGIPAGYYVRIGGRLLNLVTDIFLILPALPLIILLGVYLGPSLLNQVLVLTLISWPFPARVVASQVVSLREREFIKVAKALGASDVRIMFGEVLPNVVNLIISNSILVIIFAILFQTAISFLGLGIPTQRMGEHALLRRTVGGNCQWGMVVGRTPGVGNIGGGICFLAPIPEARRGTGTGGEVMALLEVENLSVSYLTDGSYVDAVRDVSFTVEKGDSLAIVGESGSGKTTLAMTLMGLLPVTAG
ncbi:ABC transporter permease [Metallosphaera hakonensis]|uniref:ABC transporter permease n=1 Tax=Metallosphaera hakonensis TaxID=79601 RepID=UPI000A4158CD|nr:ABC transporter permease subunit [Metallosphaera hakonensis]